MSDGSLSQDEIDALLAGTGDIDLGSGGGMSGGGGGSSSGTSVDGLRAALAETVSQQQSNMAMITGQEIEVAPPTANTGAPSGLSGDVVQIVYNFGEAGTHLYVMSSDDALKFASASMGLDGVDLDEAALNAVQEVFSQIAGPVVNTLSDRTGVTIMPTPAEASIVDASSVGYPIDPVYARYAIQIGSDDSATVYEIFEASFASRLGAGGGMGAGQMGGGQFGGGQMGGGQRPGGQMGGGQMGGMAPGMGGGMSNMMGGGMPGYGGGANVQSVQFPSLQGSGNSMEQGNIGLLMDVYMEMTVELGRTKKLIREILGMGEGTIIELDKLAGEPVDILVNHKLIAKGEVVVIDENFGVRVTEIVSPMERVSDMT